MIFKKDLHPLLPKAYDFGKRRASFRRTLALLEEREAKVLVETGTARHGLAQSRSDGASTIVFAAWASKHDAMLYSVDHDIQAIAFARKALIAMELEDFVDFANAESAAFLEHFDHSIDFLYLDSFDYDKKDREQQQRCQEHHLLEFKNAEDKLHESSVVLIDDCRLAGGGKGKLVIEHALKRGWKVHLKSYQCLLIR